MQRLKKCNARLHSLLEKIEKSFQKVGCRFL